MKSNSRAWAIYVAHEDALMWYFELAYHTKVKATRHAKRIRDAHPDIVTKIVKIQFEVQE